ncbi:MAG: hypothetical protein KIS96_12710 [Bauldia sp.]|nr:hypothetical protein [Bauldia sp.]
MGNVREAGLAALEAEILAERAASLARAGERLERAVAALGAAAGDAPERAALRDAAREALWALIVQREACGFRDSDGVIAAYGVPAEVSALVLPPPLRRWRPRRA